MNTAILPSGPVTVGHGRRATLVARIVYRVESALASWRRTSDDGWSREDLAERFELRRQADRLREEQFRRISVTRLI